MLHELEEPQREGFSRKTSKARKVCAEVPGMKATMLQIGKIAEKVAELERENAILRKDLAELYSKYKELIKKEPTKLLLGAKPSNSEDKKEGEDEQPQPGTEADGKTDKFLDDAL
jgi:hypothetical protein